MLLNQRLSSLLWMWIALLPLSASGQGQSDFARERAGLREGPQADFLCFRGAPRARCELFALTEFALYIAPPSSSRRPPINLVWEAGLMANLEVHDLAVGGSLFIVNDEEPRRMFGIKLRVRRWLNSWLSLDFAPGLLLASMSDITSFEPKYPALSSHVALNFGDWAALSMQFELLPLERSNVYPDGREISVYFGLRFGSYAGVAAGGVAALGTAYAESISD